MFMYLKQLTNCAIFGIPFKSLNPNPNCNLLPQKSRFLTQNSNPKIPNFLPKTPKILTQIFPSLFLIKVFSMKTTSIFASAVVPQSTDRSCSIYCMSHFLSVPPCP